ncbi:uncharacterized protein LOC133173835 isoform X2 [Saccostrea echinata]|uniref:uncharacterized protein LOC133173835 isoform X2 n=1 Tax=Saccostrea echinata TaxID=191078 RepID=UPI002A7ED106|nr:uncharacterized protein LOC133173835 isoform X2 [Saccostrea echinata]
MFCCANFKGCLGSAKGSKKKTTNNDAANGKEDEPDPRWSVAGRKHTYEECHPEDEDDKPDPGAQEQYKVTRAPRQYEDIDKDYEQQKAETKDSNNARLSQKQSGELNYVDVEFTKPQKKKKSKKDKESDSSDVPAASVEYSEVVIQNSKPTIN